MGPDSLRARDLMTTEVVTVPPSTPATSLARLLADRGISAAPVTDVEGRLLGIVTEADLLRRLAGAEDKPAGWLRRLFRDPDRQAEQYARTHGKEAQDVMTEDVVSVDLDATAVQFAGDQLFDLAFYNHLETRDGSVVHLGDNLTGQGEGDDEQLTLDLSRVYAKVDTIVLLVSSYQGHSLEWVANAYCRLVGEDDVELARYTLTAGPAQTGVVMATLVRTGDGWTLRAVGEGIAARVPTDAVDALRAFL